MRYGVLKKSFSWPILAIWIAALLLLGAKGVAFLIRVRTNMPPTPVAIPAAALPSPNAYDYYLNAGKYVKGRANLKLGIEAREKVLRDNAKALRLLREGFKYRYVCPPLRGVGYVNKYEVVWDRLHKFPALLGCERMSREMRHDYAGAMNSYIDAVKVGEDLPHGGGIMGSMDVRLFCCVGRSTVWHTIEELDAKQSRAAVLRLENIMSNHVPFADILEQDKWTTVSELLDAMNHRDWQKFVQSYRLKNKAIEKSTDELRITLLGKDEIIKRYIEFSDQWIANAKRPYAAGKCCPKDRPFPFDGDVYPQYDIFRFEYIRDSETGNALLMLSLALHAYKLEHNEYPDSLSDLVPSYVKKIPSDPFKTKGQLGYKRTGKCYVLYSVGPDGKDDGGRPIIDPTVRLSIKPTLGEIERQHYVTEKSKGDIVAGVNKW